MLHEQRFLHLILIWELTNAPPIGTPPYSDFNSVRAYDLPQGPVGVV